MVHRVSMVLMVPKARRFPRARSGPRQPSAVVLSIDHIRFGCWAMSLGLLGFLLFVGASGSVWLRNSRGARNPIALGTLGTPRPEARDQTPNAEGVNSRGRRR